jgi:multicomponent Na+:H+ antiporter subunit B
MMRRFTSLLFLAGLAVLMVAIYQQLGAPAASNIGALLTTRAGAEVGAANFVTSVVLGYRGFDTLLELTILFTAASAAGMVLGRAETQARKEADAGLILQAGSELLFPLLVVVGLYIILHGHLTPGGGFQGGVVLAAAFFVPLLARPGRLLDHRAATLIEGLAGASFILIGLLAMSGEVAFLAPMFDKGEIGALLSAGSLPLLYVAVGLKVGAELAGLLARLAEVEVSE